MSRGSRKPAIPVVCALFTLLFAAVAWADSPALTNPPSGTVLYLTNQTWAWSFGTWTNASNYQVGLGTTTNGTSIWLSATTTNLFTNYFALPVDSNYTLHARLSFMTNGVKYSNLYTYTVAPPNADVLSAPANGGKLGMSPVAFSWTHAATNDGQYQLWIGTSPTLWDLYQMNVGTNLSQQVVLTIDGSTYYSQLRSKAGDQWLSNIYTHPTITSNVWRMMDYRATGFVWQTLSWPNSNTDYSLFWRGIRAARGEAGGFATQTHVAAGGHATGSILGIHIADHALTNGVQYSLSDMYWPGITVTQSFTNLVYHWTNYGAVTTDGIHVYPGNAAARFRQRDNPWPAINEAGSGYVDGDNVTLDGGTYDHPAVYRANVEGGVVISVTPVGYTDAFTRGYYTEEPTGVWNTTTDGSGTGLKLDVTSCFKFFPVGGSWTGLAEGMGVLVLDNDTSAAWTNHVETLVETYFLGDTSLPFESINATLFTLPSITTNVVPHPTWTNSTFQELQALFSVVVQTNQCSEQTVTIGPNGLKLWVKTVVWQMATYGQVEWQWTGPNVDLQNFRPPMTQIFAVVVTALGDPQMMMGENWTNTTGMLSLPAAMTTTGWPTNANGQVEFSVRQWWGQPAAAIFKFGAPYRLQATGGVTAIVIGR